MTLFPDPAIVTMLPAARYPVGMGSGWGFIDTWDPNVTVAIPAMVARVPFPIRMLVRARRDSFMFRMWRANANNYLCVG
jgi:hypothetical protein